MSTTTCYHCNGLREVSAGQHLGDERSTLCPRCGGTGMEPEDLELEAAPQGVTEPVPVTYAQLVCAHCTAANCPTRGDPTVVFCWGETKNHKPKHRGTTHG